MLLEFLIILRSGDVPDFYKWILFTVTINCLLKFLPFRWICDEYLIKLGYSQEDIIISENLALFVLQTLAKSKRSSNETNLFLTSKNLCHLINLRKDKWNVEMITDMTGIMQYLFWYVQRNCCVFYFQFDFIKCYFWFYFIINYVYIIHDLQ